MEEPDGADPFEDGHYRMTADEFYGANPYAGVRRDQETYMDTLDHHTNFSIQDQIEAVRLLGAQESHARAQVEYLMDMTKVVLAEEIELARTRLEQADAKAREVTVQRLESDARRSTPYKRHLELVRDAKKEHGTMAANYYAARNTLEGIMASLSVLKSEMFLQGKS